MVIEQKTPLSHGSLGILIPGAIPALCCVGPVAPLLPQVLAGMISQPPPQVLLDPHPHP